MVAETAIDSEQDHRPELPFGAFEHLADFVGLEHPKAPLLAFPAKDLFGGTFEDGPEAEGPVNVPVVESEIEQDSGPGYLVSERNGAHPFGELIPQLAEVLGTEILNKPVAADHFEDPLANLMVVVEGAGRDLPALELPLLGGDEMVAEVYNGEAALGRGFLLA